MASSRYLLDTSICVFLLRGKYGIEKKIEEIGIKCCCISEITVAELLYGAVWSGNPDNITLTRGLCENLEIIPIYGSLMDYACLKSRLRRDGIGIDDFDLLIGCGAIANNMVLVTDNEKHFNRLPVRVENWVERR